MPLSAFHPVTARWFEKRFREPTEAQRMGWPQIAARNHTLIAAPTGSGKTLAAFLFCIDRLMRQALNGELADETQVVYISPLKALGNDVERNLRWPLAEIRAVAELEGFAPTEIRSVVRSGDTPQSVRQAMVRRPPHIVVTTPESLYLLLTGAKSREMLRTVQTVIVDEIHALARDKRGSHLALSLERLAALCQEPPVRIGLSATQRPVDEIARFLVGTRGCDPLSRDDPPSLCPLSLGGEGLFVQPAAAAAVPRCEIIDIGHIRDLDLGIEVPVQPLAAVCSNETWKEVYGRITELVNTHRSTLIFVNTRRMAERVAHQLSELLGEDAVASHHGSLSREIRLSAEQRLKDGTLRAIVATASLELGIDVGYIDLVCQIGSSRSIATLLQRVGRSGHSLGKVPCGRLFPLTRDDLVECMALVRAVRRRWLDRVEIPPAPLDILAQQIVAAVACEPWDEDALFNLFRRAWPYCELRREDYDAVVAMLSEGIHTGRRRTAYLHRDGVHRQLRARRGARLAAVCSGGAIPENAEYRVVTEESRTFVGTVNEDFAIESLAGDIFLLGNTSWRIRQIRAGEVIVEDARGAPATVPFWLGEAPGRTIELSSEVSSLRQEIGRQLVSVGQLSGDADSGKLKTSKRCQEPFLDGVANQTPDAESLSDRAAEKVPDTFLALQWLAAETGATPWAAHQCLQYVATQVAAIGVVPSQERIVFERFFDDSGGMQLVIHSPYGGRINRAWGLAMRKRFCRSFDFELQASADDNGIVLSLGPQHSFPIDSMFRMLNTQNAEQLLTQALLAVPMFQIRWRWNCTRALAVLRQQGGTKVPPPLQRFRSDDLLSAIFPAQTACQENQTGDIEIPSHPLVNQTVFDCLHEAMDVDRWLALLRRIEAGEVELLARDTREPSPFCYEILNANPYAFLDDAPLEERRARAVATRRLLSPDDVRDLARLDAAAIDQVRQEAWPLVRDREELHDALLLLGALPECEAAGWSDWFDELVSARRATRLLTASGRSLWVAAERWQLVSAAYPSAEAVPALRFSSELASPGGGAAPGANAHGSALSQAANAHLALVRGRLESSGPVRAVDVATDLEMSESAVRAALEALEGEGVVLQGRFVHGVDETQWCERRLLARIHRLSLEGARRAVEPVDPRDFLKYLIERHQLASSHQVTGRKGLSQVIGALQGFEAPAGAWEHDILPARVKSYDPRWLDELTLSGEVAWGRLCPPAKRDDEHAWGSGLSRVVPISLALRADLDWLLPADRHSPEAFARANAALILEALARRGASFLRDLVAATGLLTAQVEDALAELSSLGLVSADAFAAIRPLISPAGRRQADGPRRRARHRRVARSQYGGGRWSRFPDGLHDTPPANRLERWARQLLSRYGVMFADLLARESAAPRWRELVPVYRRLEARGEIRGGRFIRGVAGEQFAEGDAVALLRKARDEPASGAWQVISAADPLNLVGIVSGEPRIPATRANRLALGDGRLVASLQAGAIQFHQPLDQETAVSMTRALRKNALVRALEDSVAETVPLAARPSGAA